MLWIVSAENGTLPQSDIDFLQKLELEHKKLYVVINKADVKPPGDLKDIAEEVQDKLDDEDIQIAGISVYSAIRKKEYLYKIQGLAGFLHSCDARLDTHKEIIAKLREVYNQYKDAIEQVIKEKKKQKKNFQQLKYQVAKIDLSYESDAAVESIEKMQRGISTNEEEKNLEDLKKVMRKFGDSVKAIFSESGDNSDWAIFDAEDEPEIEISDKNHLQEIIHELMDTYGPNVNLNHLDVSNVTNMSRLFTSTQEFNGDISRWNVSNVTNMEGMFAILCLTAIFPAGMYRMCIDTGWMFQNSQFNGDLSGWDVGKCD